MLRRCTAALFKVSAPADVRGTLIRGGAVPQRRRQFTRASAGPSSSEKRPASHSFIPPQRATRGSQAVGRVVQGGQEHAASPFPDGGSFTSPEASASPSQRQRYHHQQRGQDRGRHGTSVDDGAPASYLSPLPTKYGFYDGIDEHALEAPRPSPALRQRMLRQALEEQAVSVVEFTDGGENDIQLGGMPASEYHGQEGWTTIPRDSALYNSVVARQELESRQRLNSWGVARRQQQTTRQAGAVRDRGGDGGVGRIMGEYAAAEAAAPPGDGTPQVLDDVRRRKHADGGAYTDMLEGELLEPTPESIGQPRSVYGLRKMFVKGLVGYQGIISPAEEAAAAEELLHLLQDPRAAYIAEETRYCVNLYETELGVPGKDTLAFPMSRVPVLQKILFRFFFLGLIPSPPNVVQVSEMIGNFSGYPVHRKPRAIGAYVGLLNLVSTSVMHMQHVDCPWYPRVHMNPRSLFVVSEPCLSEYAMGYKQTHQPFHTFEYATRVSKDYRIEVMFATVETEHMKHLNEAVQLTEYASQKMQGTATAGESTVPNPQHRLALPGGHSASDASPGSRVDDYLERLRAQMHAAAEGNESASWTAVVDGNLLRRQLQEEGRLGSKTHPFASQAQSGKGSPSAAVPASPASVSSAPSTAAQRRLAALKARHDFAKRLRKEETVARVSGGGGPTLIRGHAPGDKRDW